MPNKFEEMQSSANKVRDWCATSTVLCNSLVEAAAEVPGVSISTTASGPVIEFGGRRFFVEFAHDFGKTLPSTTVSLREQTVTTGEFAPRTTEIVAFVSNGFMPDLPLGDNVKEFASDVAVRATLVGNALLRVINFDGAGSSMAAWAKLAQ